MATTLSTGMTPFNVQLPAAPAVPIVVSVPHCGTTFPEEIRNDYRPDLIQAPDDTDWFVDRLYDFAPSMGMTLISAVYSRWVIDLNRDPASKPLYSDGRIITALCPTTTFLGEPLYRDNRSSVNDAQVQRRLDRYYYPYHQKIQQLLDDLKAKFGKVLLWDCHSIRDVVPTIQATRFPDLILGDADGTAAAPLLTETALRNLAAGPYKVNHNRPFKGGIITRHFGRPAAGQHALQLEMIKPHYMDDAQTKYDEGRAGAMRGVLKRTFDQLIACLKP